MSIVKRKGSISGQVTGQGEVVKALQATMLNDKEQFDVLKQMCAPVVQQLQATAPMKTGKVKRSIRVYRSAKNPYSQAQVGPQYIKGGGPDAGNAAHFTEFGTADRQMHTGLKNGKLVSGTLEPFKGPPQFAPYAGKKLGRVQSIEWIQQAYQSIKDTSLSIGEKQILEKIKNKAKQNGIG